MAETVKPKNRVGKELEERTLDFAVRVVEFCTAIPRSDAGIVMARQLLRSGTSIGANYREANRAESADDFIHKVAVALKEAAETEYWLHLCRRTGLCTAESVESLSKETDELIAILTTIHRRARASRH